MSGAGSGREPRLSSQPAGQLLLLPPPPSPFPRSRAPRRHGGLPLPLCNARPLPSGVTGNGPACFGGGGMVCPAPRSPPRPFLTPETPLATSQRADGGRGDGPDPAPVRRSFGRGAGDGHGPGSLSLRTVIAAAGLRDPHRAWISCRLTYNWWKSPRAGLRPLQERTRVARCLG